MPNDESILKQNLTTYKNPDYTAREVANCIQRYRSLTYSLEAFVFNNGARKDLLNLNGTVPVNFKGTTYNIPVCIWLMDTHPDNAPLCFVKPTPDMAIKISKFVDNNGKVYLPYLHEWNSHSTLLNLIQCMIQAFGQIPPVFSKPRTDMRPSYPMVNNFPVPETSYPYPTSSVTGPPNYTTPYPPQVPMNGVPYMPAPVNPMPYPPGPSYPKQDVSGGTITEEHIKASLLSAVEDKLRRRLNEQSQQSQAELDTLKRTQHELIDCKGRLEDIMSALQREITELDKNVSILQNKEEELKTAVEKLSGQESIDVDEAVVTTAPLYSQLLNAFAEEATLEDAIYYMGEALRKEVIDLDTFLKQVRALARRQFTLRALMNKCRQKAQLAC